MAQGTSLSRSELAGLGEQPLLQVSVRQQLDRVLYTATAGFVAPGTVLEREGSSVLSVAIEPSCVASLGILHEANKRPKKSLDTGRKAYVDVIGPCQDIGSLPFTIDTLLKASEDSDTPLVTATFIGRQVVCGVKPALKHDMRQSRLPNIRLTEVVSRSLGEVWG